MIPLIPGPRLPIRRVRSFERSSESHSHPGIGSLRAGASLSPDSGNFRVYERKYAVMAGVDIFSRHRWGRNWHSDQFRQESISEDLSVG